jgi:hypothetical protein
MGVLGEEGKRGGRGGGGAAVSGRERERWGTSAHDAGGGWHGGQVAVATVRAEGRR